MGGYYPEKSRWKKKYELTIPILLFILVAVVLAWQLGYLPLGEWFGGGGPTDVLIVGEDKAMSNSLRNIEGVNVNPMNLSEIKGVSDPAYLDQYDLIVLTEELGNNSAEMPSTFRDYVSQRLGDGADLMIYGVAASKVPNSQSDGWKQHGMDEYVPVKCPGPQTCSGEKESHSSNIVRLAIENIEHPILKEFPATNYEFDKGMQISYPPKLNLRSGSENLATLEIQEGKKAGPGVVEKSYGMGGKAIYFSYHPTKTPDILKNSINYLKG